jgi:hypothetical protein
MAYLGAWGTLIYEKKLRSKISLKVLCHQLDIVLKAYTLLYVHAHRILKFMVCLATEKIQFLLASLKTFTNSKDCSESCILLFQFTFAFVG